MRSRAVAEEAVAAEEARSGLSVGGVGAGGGEEEAGASPSEAIGSVFSFFCFAALLKSNAGALRRRCSCLWMSLVLPRERKRRRERRRGRRKGSLKGNEKERNAESLNKKGRKGRKK